LQPAAVFVPVLHVRLSVPPVAAAAQSLSQVMAQVPPRHKIFAPEPTVWVQSLPEQVTLHPVPHAPVQLESAAQVKLQPAVEAEHVSKAQVVPVGQAQLFPEQTVPQPVKATSVSDKVSARVESSFMGSRLQG
jgi:hypothetical protein